MKVERSIISISGSEASELESILSYMKMTEVDRFKTITFLRESFYGAEATTGRLQRIFEFTERKLS